jgi:hypothetical protein
MYHRSVVPGVYGFKLSASEQFRMQQQHKQHQHQDLEGNNSGRKEISNYSYLLTTGPNDGTLNGDSNNGQIAACGTSCEAIHVRAIPEAVRVAHGEDVHEYFDASSMRVHVATSKKSRGIRYIAERLQYTLRWLWAWIKWIGMMSVAGTLLWVTGCGCVVACTLALPVLGLIGILGASVLTMLVGCLGVVIIAFVHANSLYRTSFRPERVQKL